MKAEGSTPFSDIASATRRVAAEVLATEADSVDREAAWPQAGMRALQRAGLAGLVVPTESGGHGLGLEALAIVCEELGQVCSSTAICFGMHSVGAAVIASKATDDQKHRYLEPIARGEHLTTLALSEPGTGAHFYLPQAKLSKQSADTYFVDGTKSFVTNGGHADSYVISTGAAHEDAPPGQFSCFVMPRDARGLSWEGKWDGWGMRGNSAIRAKLTHLEVPVRDLLGTEGDETWYVFNVVTPFFLVAMAGTYVGIAAAALDEARQHLLGRVHAHSGLELARNPILQHRFGQLWAQVERTRCLVREASRKGDAGLEDALPALCSAKAEVADCADRVTAECMTIMGGLGYAEGSRIHRLYRDARAAHVMSPTTDLLRTWTGRALLGLPLLGG